MKIFIILCIVAICLAENEKKKDSKDAASNGNQGKGQMNNNQAKAPQNGASNGNQGKGQQNAQNNGNQGKSGQNSNQGKGQQSSDSNGSQGKGQQNGKGPMSGNQDQSKNGKQQGPPGRGPPSPPRNGGGPQGPGGPGGPGMGPPCNMTNYPKGVDGRQCCPSKPKSFNRQNAEACKTECGSIENRTEKHCCWSKCLLKLANVSNEDGTINKDSVVKVLTNSTTKPEVWAPLLDALVAKCIADAPAMVEKFQNMTNRTDPCGDAQNKAIAFCIARELFLQCPEAEKNNTNADCAKLFDFAKTCPAYPFFGHHGKGHCNHKSGEKSGEKSGDKSGDNTNNNTPSGAPPTDLANNTKGKSSDAKGNSAANKSSDAKGNSAAKKPSDTKGNSAANKPSDAKGNSAANKPAEKQQQGKKN